MTKFVLIALGLIITLLTLYVLSWKKRPVLYSQDEIVSLDVNETTIILKPLKSTISFPAHLILDVEEETLIIKPYKAFLTYPGPMYTPPINMILGSHDKKMGLYIYHLPGDYRKKDFKVIYRSRNQ